MIFFESLGLVEFFIEIEKYYGEYEENIRIVVFSFIKKLNDWERAALYNELIEHYSRGFSPPDVYRFNLHLKKAKEAAKRLKPSMVLSKKEENKEDIQKNLAEAAKEYGLDPNGKDLLKKNVCLRDKKKKRLNNGKDSKGKG